MLTKFAAITALSLAVLGSAADARTVSFAFEGTGRTGPAFGYSQDGLDLRAFGLAYTPGGIVQTNLTEWDRGFGMSTYHDDTHMIDGHGPDEFVGLAFSQEIERIDSITFDFVDAEDMFALFGVVDGAPDLLEHALISPSARHDSTATYTFAANESYAGQLFGIGALGEHDTFKLRGLTVSVADVAPVPLPAAGLFLVGGLASLGLVRRRRARA